MSFIGANESYSIPVYGWGKLHRDGMQSQETIVGWNLEGLVSRYPARLPDSTAFEYTCHGQDGGLCRTRFVTLSRHPGNLFRVLQFDIFRPLVAVALILCPPHHKHHGAGKGVSNVPVQPSDFK